MEEADFTELVDEVLLPMFPGASRGRPVPLKARRRKTVSYAKAGGGNQLLVRAEERSTFEILIGRRQKFQSSELALASAFVAGAADIADAFDKPFEAEVRRGLPVRVVSRAAGGARHEVLLRVLEQFAAWAAEQYEGKPVVSAVGIDHTLTGHFDVASLWKESFAPVLSNGMDTLVIVDGVGLVASLTAVDASALAPFSPFRYAHIAAWSSNGRIAAVLNRNGEILVFTDGLMRFALRRGRWCHFTHSAIVSSIHLPQRKEAKGAVYQTLLDVAFARCGGCIAVVDKTNAAQVATMVSTKDLVNPGPTETASLKADLLSKAVGTTFADLDRRVRAELVAMDGATILNHQGKILAAGAIVKIGPGSSGGGRLAAAKALAKLGFAAKVSQDGGVTGFDAAGRLAVKSDDKWEPSFRFG